MPIESNRLYHELGNLISETPDMATYQWQTPEGQHWLGRASALIEECGDTMDAIAFNCAAGSLSLHAIAPINFMTLQRMTAILYRALAWAELQAPHPARGAFIPAGESFSAFTGISKILASASRKVMFVDPYADANLLTDFAVLVPEGVTTLILADVSGKKPALAPELTAWKQQYHSTRPLEARLSPERSLHDRLTILTSKNPGVWGNPSTP